MDRPMKSKDLFILGTLYFYIGLSFQLLLQLSLYEQVLFYEIFFCIYWQGRSLSNTIQAVWICAVKVPCSSFSSFPNANMFMIILQFTSVSTSSTFKMCGFQHPGLAWELLKIKCNFGRVINHLYSCNDSQDITIYASLIHWHLSRRRDKKMNTLNRTRLLLLY